jgi:hypothetical protein
MTLTMSNRLRFNNITKQCSQPGFVAGLPYPAWQAGEALPASLDLSRDFDPCSTYKILTKYDRKRGRQDERFEIIVARISHASMKSYQPRPQSIHSNHDLAAAGRGIAHFDLWLAGAENFVAFFRAAWCRVRRHPTCVSRGLGQ